jgi:hypothetical protein
MKKASFKNPYTSENDLCNTFIEYAKNNGYKIYCETSGFDILVVKDDFQIGIQAKMRGNIEVLAQIVDWPQDSIGPNIRAVLIPHSTPEFKRICVALGIYIIEATRKRSRFFNLPEVWIKEIQPLPNQYDALYLRQMKRCWVPDINIEVPAGVKSPKLITPWKIKAVKLCMLLDEKGYLTSQDFKNVRVNMTLWKKKWLTDSKQKEGKLTKYIKKVGAKLPDETYPDILEAIKKLGDKK